MSLIARSLSKPVVVASARQVRAVLPRPITYGRPRISTIARAAAEEDPAERFKEQVQDSVKWLQTRWEETSDAEKPAAVAIIIGVTIAQIAIGATVDAVDRVPFIHQFLEFVGLAVVSVYGYRYVTDPAERDSVKKSIDSFVAAVTGK